jgi:pantoate--beta-alanine ligase
MSSRNVYLSRDQRLIAPVLYRAMKESARRLRSGDDVAAAMARGAELIVGAGFKLDYFELRHAETLAPYVARPAGDQGGGQRADASATCVGEWKEAPPF